MHFDTDGVYTLLYTAEDGCGNETIEEREVIVATPRTVLYTDGTFIINEQPQDQATNIALHGVATNVYAPFDPNGDTNAKKYIFTGASQRPWNSQASSVKSVEIGSNIQPTSTRYWFYMFGTCTSMDLDNLDTSAVTNMNYMFYGCVALTSLDVSNFNTSAVTNMNSMFYYCRALTTLDLSSFDTSAATDMGSMFNKCQALTTIYASADFVVTQVTSSSSMFVNMSTNLVGGAGTVWSASNPLDKTYAHIDGGTSNPGYFTAKPTYRTVLYTDGTFIINENPADRTTNETLHGVATNVYDPFDPNGNTDVKKYIFTGSSQRPWNSQISSINSVEIGSNIQPTSTTYWFKNFENCTSIDLDGLNTSAVTNMNDMFGFCKVLTSLDVTHFDTSAVTDMGYMFNECRALTNLDVTHFDTSAVTDMSKMFFNCKALTSLDVTHFDTSAVTNMDDMFCFCQALATIYASSAFVVSQVTSSSNMFAAMSTNLVGGAGTVWSSSNVNDKTYAHIDGGTSNPGYFTAKA